jgi:DNA-binding NarL/FixJ family response regulator
LSWRRTAHGSTAATHDEESGFRRAADQPRGAGAELLAEGLPNKAIATRLGISDQTVKFHVASIAGKLGAATAPTPSAAPCAAG